MAQNGEEAVRLSAEQVFDLILMDVRMPVLDGLDATRAIRARELQTGSRVPILALTANALKDDREQCLAAGMDGYLAKPVRKWELYEAIDSLLAETASADAGTDSTAPQPEGLDWRTALEAMGNDPELLDLVATACREELPRLHQELRTAVMLADPVNIRRLAHTIKGSVRSFGTGPLVHHAQRLEEMGKRAELHGLQAACDQLTLELDRFLAYLQTAPWTSDQREWLRRSPCEQADFRLGRWGNAGSTLACVL